MAMNPSKREDIHRDSSRQTHAANEFGRKRPRQSTLEEYDDIRQVKQRCSPKALAMERVLRDVVLRFAVKISESLKILGALFPWLFVPMFRYLTHGQLQELKMLPTERRRAEQLLLDLKLVEEDDCDPSPTFRKFVASLCVEERHMGHQSIARMLEAALPLSEWSKIQGMADKGRSPSLRVKYGMTIKEFVQSLSPEICKYLKMKGALLPLLCIPEFSFLSPHQLQELYRLPSDEAVGEELLLLLDTAEELSYCKFVSCLLMESEHRGHREIVKILIETMQSLQNMEMPQLLVCIELKGDIVGKEFVKINRSLWEMFEKKEYTAVIQQTQRIRLDPNASVDRQIVAASFEAVTLVHRGTGEGNFQKAITHLLLPALELCGKSENSLILQGRICLRMAQIYLQMKHPDLAEVYFGIAKGSLFLSGRGYDKFKMFCREAKLLTVSEPQNRKEIERLFDAALDNISGNELEPYASTCIESVLLSKAALYLSISFGTTQSNFRCRQPFPDDVTKARRILSLFEKRELNNMRECEYKLLTAELLRLEGSRDRAFEIFDGLSRGRTKKMNRNVVEIAEHRCNILK